MNKQYGPPHGAVASGYDPRDYPHAPWYVITNTGVWTFAIKAARDEAHAAFARENREWAKMRKDGTP